MNIINKFLRFKCWSCVQHYHCLKLEFVQTFTDKDIKKSQTKIYSNIWDHLHKIALQFYTATCLCISILCTYLELSRHVFFSLFTKILWSKYTSKITYKKVLIRVLPTPKIFYQNQHIALNSNFISLMFWNTDVYMKNILKETNV